MPGTQPKREAIQFYKKIPSAVTYPLIGQAGLKPNILLELMAVLKSKLSLPILIKDRCLYTAIVSENDAIDVVLIMRDVFAKNLPVRRQVPARSQVVSGAGAVVYLIRRPIQLQVEIVVMVS